MHVASHYKACVVKTALHLPHLLHLLLPHLLHLLPLLRPGALLKRSEIKTLDEARRTHISSSSSTSSSRTEALLRPLWNRTYRVVPLTRTQPNQPPAPPPLPPPLPPPPPAAAAPMSSDHESCHLCKESLREPVSIPCGHVFCSICLKTYWDHTDPSGSYLCPQCRVSYNKRPTPRRLGSSRYSSSSSPALRSSESFPPPPPKGWAAPRPKSRRGFTTG
ncbi:hypothetical protein CRUP_005520 [Coryphaenoides rupestris]|nr:hypothetical protein CRUP_005520 [Coryphaenoides rupestris]